MPSPTPEMPQFGRCIQAFRRVETYTGIASSKTRWERICFINKLSTETIEFPHLILVSLNCLFKTMFPGKLLPDTRSRTLHCVSRGRLNTPSKKKQSAKIYQFPLPLGSELPSPEEEHPVPVRLVSPHDVSGHYDVVPSGTFRKDPNGLRLVYEHLKELGFNVLSPSNVSIDTEEEGFVYMEGESRYSPEDIESRHLDAIQKAAFVWLHAPEGYVGISGSLEVGFARAVGIPVYCQDDIQDPIVRQFVQKLVSPDRLIDVVGQVLTSPPRPPIRAFQNYYRRAALTRGYSKEDAKDTLVLMLEEMGELARAIRKGTGLARHGSYPDTEEGLELADVFLYVIHLANVLKVDLGALVQQKEIHNLRKFEQALSR